MQTKQQATKQNWDRQTDKRFQEPQGWAMAWDGFALAANEQRRAKSDRARPDRKG